MMSMNFLNQYYVQSNDEQLSITAEQASAFAKGVAHDFNPIHDPGSKRFCVPGDLLFAIALEKYGLNSKMSFRFLNLVSADLPLHYPQVETSDEEVEIDVVCDQSKPILGISFSGECSKSASKIEQVLRNYVKFSGQNFPHILVPLMEKHNVMINPQRPLVIYDSMSFEFERMDFDELEIILAETSLEVEGRRGNTQLNFTFMGDGEKIGSGSKTLVMGGLREYEQEAIDKMCADYEASKQA